eukprot:1495026-Rhodomonas_salina.3
MGDSTRQDMLSRFASTLRCSRSRMHAPGRTMRYFRIGYLAAQAGYRLHVHRKDSSPGCNCAG